jgi:general secretion pathway protein D
VRSKNNLKPGRSTMPMRLSLLGMAVLLAACATGGSQQNRDGMSLLAQGKRAEGLDALRKASELEPSNAKFRLDYTRERAQQAQAALLAGDLALSKNRLDEAQARYRDAIALEPGSDRALRGLMMIEERKRAEVQLAQAERLVKAGQYEGAQEILTRMAREPHLPGPARAMLKEVDDKVEAARVDREEKLATTAAFRKPVTLQFRDASIKLVFEAISRATNVNIILDRDVRPDLRTTIFVKDATVEDSINLILLQSQLEKRVLNSNTLLIYPATPAKQREYAELKVRSFQLSNVEAAFMANILKTMLKTRDIVTDAKTNTLVMRDTPEAITVAEQLIAANDQPDAEIMLEVEVLEVSTARAQKLGLSWPTGFDVKIPSGADTVGEIKGLRSNDLSFNSSSSAGLGIGARFELTDSDSNVLASPRIRVRNKEKAKILVGDKVPTFSNLITPSTAGTTSGNSVITGSIQYLDVGIKLEVEPQVYADGDVGLKLNLEVSSLGAVSRNASGEAYRIGTRSAQTSLRMKDGETQVLGGLIQDSDKYDAAKVPGLGELPMLSRIFGNDSTERSKTELVVLITPRIVRPMAVTDPAMANIWSGSEGSVRNKPIRIDPIGGVKIGDGKSVSAPALPAPTAAPARATPPAPPPAFTPTDEAAPASAAPAAAPASPAPAPAANTRLRPASRGGGLPPGGVLPRPLPGRAPAPMPAPAPAPEPPPESNQPAEGAGDAPTPAEGPASGNGT